MITTALKIDEEGLTKRTIKDVHAALREALRRAAVLDSLNYFEISMAMKKRENRGGCKTPGG